MWYAGQRVICTNDHFSGAIWDWTSTVPREGEVYTIAALERLPQWNTRTPILSFLLQELREDDCEAAAAYFSAWRFEPAESNPPGRPTPSTRAGSTPPKSREDGPIPVLAACLSAPAAAILLHALATHAHPRRAHARAGVS